MPRSNPHRSQGETNGRQIAVDPISYLIVRVLARLARAATSGAASPGGDLGGGRKRHVARRRPQRGAGGQGPRAAFRR
jgi:hypothetical protein